MLENNLSILCWNVRGLNCPDRRAAVHQTIASSSCHLVCIQESKLQTVDPFIAAYLGGQRLKNFAQRLADGTKGGILLLWDETVLSVTDVQIGAYFLSATVAFRNSSDPKTFKLTTVYGPTRNNHKDAFFLELKSRLQVLNGSLMAISTKFTVLVTRTVPTSTATGLFGSATLSMLVSSRRSISKTENSLGAMNKVIQLSVSLIASFAMKIGTLNSRTTYSMPSHRCSLIAVLCCLPTILHQRGQRPSALRTIGSRCQVSKMW